MSTDIQTIAAPLVVLAAMVYLFLRWRQNRHQSSCGSAGQCACPGIDKAKLKLPSIARQGDI
ncbi:MAG: hypothetical protein J6386_00695 [Candidatus Synoicihabitans palmerolidicus]|nr:hypothetical protein [Candidatus Synoicihabitans palmerolidicus]